MMPYKLRATDAEDSSFIFNSWLKSYRNSDFAKAQCNAVYFENHKQIIHSILERSLMVVVCNPEDDSHMFGYIIYEKLAGNNLLVHYLYIKHTYRRMKLAKALIDHVKSSDNPILSSHYTNVCRHFNNPIVIYDPYKMFEIIDKE